MNCLPPAAIRRRHLFLVLLGLLPLFAGCAGGPPAKQFPEALSADVPREIEHVPFHPQDTMQCGPAALATVLGWSGVDIAPGALEPLLFLPGREGTLQPEIMAQARRLGRIPYEIPADPRALVDELAAGHPVLVLQNNGLGWYPAWHYAVVVGMDPESDTLRLRSGRTEDYDIGSDTFLRTWRRAGYWGVAVLPPDTMPASVRPAPVLSAITDFSRVAGETEVASALQAAVSRWPEDAGLRFALANHWYEAGNYAEAEAEYRRILAFAPDAVMARNNLAWMLAELGRTDEALAVLPADPEKTAAEVPQDPWAASLADTAAFVRCRAAGGSVADCTAAPSPVD
ncbi:MAG TPA: PA2778 family cysteine peptidase [Gammaproteobacteria bacterium]